MVGTKILARSPLGQLPVIHVAQPQLFVAKPPLLAAAEPHFTRIAPIRPAAPEEENFNCQSSLSRTTSGQDWYKYGQELQHRETGSQSPSNSPTHQDCPPSRTRKEPQPLIFGGTATRQAALPNGSPPTLRGPSSRRTPNVHQTARLTSRRKQHRTPAGEEELPSEQHLQTRKHLTHCGPTSEVNKKPAACSLCPSVRSFCEVGQEPPTGGASQEDESRTTKGGLRTTQDRG